VLEKGFLKEVRLFLQEILQNAFSNMIWYIILYKSQKQSK